jgi:hypothetical protein
MTFTFIDDDGLANERWAIADAFTDDTRTDLVGRGQHGKTAVTAAVGATTTRALTIANQHQERRCDEPQREVSGNAPADLECLRSSLS